MTKQHDIEELSLYSKPEESPGYLLWRMSTQWRNYIENTLKPLDLTHPQFVILAATGWLTKKSGRISQAEVGRMTGLDPNTTSQILRGLEAKKLIERTRSIDERSKNPILTNTGSKILSKALPAVEAADTQFFATLNTKESEALKKIFQKLLLQK